MNPRAHILSNAAYPPTSAIGLIACLLAFTAMPFATTRHTTILIADAVFLVISGAAAALCVVAANRNPAKRATWFAAAGTAGFWCIAQAFMLPEHLGLTTNDWLEHGADLTSMLVGPCLAAGLVALAHVGQSQRIRREMALDASLAIVAAAAIAYEVVGGPVRDPDSNASWLLSLAIVWQVAALVGFSVLTVGVIWRARAFAPEVAAPLIGALAALLAGAGCYVAGALGPGYHPGSPIDLPFFAGFWLLIVAARRSLSMTHGHDRPHGFDYIRWRTGLVAASTLAVGGIALYGASLNGRNSVIIGLLIVATLILTVRVALGASDHLRLDRRTAERDRLAAVLDLSSAISESLDLNHVLSRLAEAGARASGRTHGRAVLLFDQHAVELVATPAGGDRPRAVDIAEARLMAAGAAAGACNVPTASGETARSRNRRTDDLGATTSVVAPLIASGELLGYVEAWTPGAIAPANSAELAAIAAIGQQGGLAVRNARLHAEMERHARTDDLTGLLNRRALLTELERLLALAALDNDQVSVLLLDVDGFKACNDAQGHAAGDRLLRELATLLAAAVREGDLAGRYGGDEFIVVLPGADAGDAERVADRIRERAHRVALVADGVTLRLRVSIGAASARDHGYAADELITAADRAMYVSKHASRRSG